MASKNDISEHEAPYGGDARPRKGHCKRFWWIYLVVFLVIVVIVVPVVILVAVPKIAQKKLDESQLTIQNVAITNTKPDTYNMAINSTITTDGKVHAIVRAFTGDMYLEDLEPHTPFASLNFPETTSDAFSVVNVSQSADVSNQDAFTTFNTWLLHNETVRVTIRGDTFVRVRGIAREYAVTYTKTVTLDGLNGFAGLNVTDANVSISPDANGDNFLGRVNIPNASVFKIEIGNATFTNYFLGAEVGTTVLDNLILVPGDNDVAMRAAVRQDAVLSNVGKRPYCETGLMPFQLLGRDVVNNGQHLPYFAKALGSANQTVNINMGAALKKSLNVTVQCTS